MIHHRGDRRDRDRLLRADDAPEGRDEQGRRSDREHRPGHDRHRRRRQPDRAGVRTRSARIARGGNIPLRYHKDPEKSAATFVEIDGKRYSIPGDFARVEDDGTVTLLGRGSVCINSGGEKIFPEEVEGALKSHPDVFDAIVVGVPDERFGSARRAPSSSRAKARNRRSTSSHEHARTKIAGYKVPARALPRRRDPAAAERQAQLPVGDGVRDRSEREDA